MNLAPASCYSCGLPIYDKIDEYLALTKLYYGKLESNDFSAEELAFHGVDNIETLRSRYSAAALALNKLGLRRQCCRRMLLTSLPIVERMNGLAYARIHA